MPVTWCYLVEDDQKVCNPGFPIGCLVNQDGNPKDACVINVREPVYHHLSCELAVCDELKRLKMSMTIVFTTVY